MLTAEFKIEQLESLRPEIQEYIENTEYFYFCLSSIGPSDNCRDFLEEYRLIDACKECGGSYSFAFFNGETGAKEYSSWKMEILEKAIELLKEAL